DMVAQKVSSLIMARRASYARSLVHPCSISCSLSSALTLWNILTNRERVHSVGADVLFFTMYSSILVVLFRPSWITPSPVELWGAWAMLMATVGASPLVTSSDKLIVVSATLGVVRLCVSLFMLKLPSLVFWNAADWGALSFHLHPWIPSVDVGHSLAYRQQSQMIIIAELFQSCFVVLLAYSMHRVTSEWARQLVEAQASRKGLEASRSMLLTVCDVVVELDANLQLTEHSPRLAAMLPRSLSHNSLVGSTLDKFMCSEDDIRRFNARMQDPAHENDTIGDVFHANMRNRFGGATEMEFFHVCFMDALTQLPQHLLGFRENSDSVLLGRSPVPEPDYIAQSDIIGHEGLPGMAVVFDALTFKVLKCSAAFVRCFGPCRAGALVCDWLHQEGPMVEVLCDNINLFANNTEPTHYFELWPLTLQLACSGQADYHVSVMLTREQSDAGDDQVLACMVLPPGSGADHDPSERSRSHSIEARARAGTVHGADHGQGRGRSSEASRASEHARGVRVRLAQRLLAELADADAAAAAPGAPRAEPSASTSRSSSWTWADEAQPPPWAAPRRAGAGARSRSVSPHSSFASSCLAI
ncbi:unnamed protein product, partial [Prorocentrum cordatum]